MLLAGIAARTEPRRHVINLSADLAQFHRILILESIPPKQRTPPPLSLFPLPPLTHWIPQLTNLVAWVKSAVEARTLSRRPSRAKSKSGGINRVVAISRQKVRAPLLAGCLTCGKRTWCAVCKDLGRVDATVWMQRRGGSFVEAQVQPSWLGYGLLELCKKLFSNLSA